MGNGCGPSKPVLRRVVMVGLAKSGKTTLFKALHAVADAQLAGDDNAQPRLGRRNSVRPTIGYNTETFVVDAEYHPPKPDAGHGPRLGTGGTQSLKEAHRDKRVAPESSATPYAPAPSGTPESAAPVPSVQADDGKGAGRYELSLWDLAGDTRQRAQWEHHLHGCETLVFVVDGQDRLSNPQACEALHSLLSHPKLPASARLCLFLNKSDIAGAMTAEGAIREFELGLLSDARQTIVKSSRGQLVGPRREWHLIEGSAERGDGLKELLSWACHSGRVGGSISERVGPADRRKRAGDGDHKPPRAVRSTITGGAVVKGKDGHHYDLSGPPAEASMAHSKARSLVSDHDDSLGGGARGASRASAGTTDGAESAPADARRNSPDVTADDLGAAAGTIRGEPRAADAEGAAAPTQVSPGSGSVSVAASEVDA